MTHVLPFCIETVREMKIINVTFSLVRKVWIQHKDLSARVLAFTTRILQNFDLTQQLRGTVTSWRDGLSPLNMPASLVLHVRSLSGVNNGIIARFIHPTPTRIFLAPSSIHCSIHYNLYFPAATRPPPPPPQTCLTFPSHSRLHQLQPTFVPLLHFHASKSVARCPAWPQAFLYTRERPRQGGGRILNLYCKYSLAACKCNWLCTSSTAGKFPCAAELMQSAFCSNRHQGCVHLFSSSQQLADVLMFWTWSIIPEQKNSLA